VGLLAAGALVPAAPAAADPVEDAKAKVVAAQQAADAAAERYEAAIHHYEELTAQIAKLQGEIAAGKARAAELRALARERAVAAYTGRSTMSAEAFLSDEDPLDQVRREKLLERTKQREDDDADELKRLTDDLEEQRDDLEERRQEQEKALATAEQQQKQVQIQLTAAQAALDELEAYLAQVEEAQKAREMAEAIARAASTRATGRSYAGAQVSTGMVCPIRGAVSFIDSWGAPRHQGAHQGVDLMSPRGTPNVAVVSGSVTFRSGGTSGNGAYLSGDNGTLYYYFHLDSYEGGARRVAQGEVIGYTGNTGDARYTATHTHFEIHPNHGSAINPYPSVRAVC
jgi:murein DD-endopeptidase MepM/ murein hydrolase activator NlpD